MTIDHTAHGIRHMAIRLTMRSTGSLGIPDCEMVKLSVSLESIPALRQIYSDLPLHKSWVESFSTHFVRG